MKSLYFAFILVLVSGCASVPFKKTDSGTGYQVINGKYPDNFTVKFNLPKNMHEQSIGRYCARAVGEECLERGYSYFMNSSDKEFETTGYCYKTNVRKGLGPTFNKSALSTVPPKFVVESLNGKTRTNLKINDEIISVDKQKPTSMPNLYQIMFDISKKQPLPDEIAVVLKRDGKEMTVKEPLADMSDNSYTPDDLARLRQTVN